MADLELNAIAHGLIQYGRELDALVTEYRELGEKSAAAKRDCELAYARVYLSTEGAQDYRRQKAIEGTADERYGADVAEHLVKACSKAIDAKRAKIEIGRTLSATTRDEMRLAGVGT